MLFRKLTIILRQGICSTDRAERDRCLTDAYALVCRMDAERPVVMGLNDMLPMFPEWVESGYATEVEWRLALEVRKLRAELDELKRDGRKSTEAVVA